MNLKKDLDLRFVFIVGLIFAIFQIGIIRQLGVVLHSIDSVNFVIYTVFLGLSIGALIDRILKIKSNQILLILLSLFTITSLGFLVQTEMIWSYDLEVIILFSLVLLPPFLLWGSLFSKILRESTDFGMIYAFLTLGTMIGFFIANSFTSVIGMNSLIIMISVICLFLGLKFRKLIVFTLILIVIFNPQIENFVEHYRLTQDLLRYEENVEIIYSAWSPYNKIDIVRFGDCIAGLYDITGQWIACPDLYSDYYIRHSLFNSTVKPENNILLIGSGGGDSLQYLLTLTKDVVAVEIDPVVVKKMKGEFASYNNYTYHKIPVFARDGLSFLESTKQKYDLIILDALTVNTPNIPKSPIQVENYLFTKESTKLIFDHLKSGGRMMSTHLSKDVTENIYHTVLSISDADEVYMYVGHNVESKRGKSLDFKAYAIISGEPLEMEGWELHKPQESNRRKITNDWPFVYFDGTRSEMYKNYLLILLFLFGAITPYIYLKNRKVVPFSFLGICFILMELFLVNRFRSFFGDPVSTASVVLAILLGFSSLGSLLSKKMRKFNRKQILSLLLLPLFSIIATSFIDRSFGLGLIEKYIITILVLSPVGFFMGLFFPLLVYKIKNNEIPLAYSLDAFGSVLGYFLFNALWFSVGLSINSMVVLIVYAIVVLLYILL
jgi:spermidine synthase